MHVTVAEVVSGHADCRDAVKPWRRAALAMYPMALAIPLWATLAFFRLVPATDYWLAVVLNGGLTAAFVAASIFSVSMSKRFESSKLTPRQRLGDRAMNGMFVLMVLLFVLLPTIGVTTQANLGMVFGRSVEIAMRSLPLAFLFVGAYFESRFEFFDVMVKRGATLLATTAALVVFFAVGLPMLERFNDRPTTPLVYAITLLPLSLALPLVHSRISSALDRWWLGRRFTVVDAVKHFISTLRSATTEAQLIALAERALEEIFGAPAKVRLGTASRGGRVRCAPGGADSDGVG